MRTLQLNKHETLCLPDEDADMNLMATYDTIGWMQIGRMGQSESLLVGKDEWQSFVRFITKLDTHMALEQSGAYAPDANVEDEA